MTASRPRTFRSATRFRQWLRANHRHVSELVIRCFRVHASHRGLTYGQALDEALCWGWIDGVRRAHDRDSFTVRFTPRKARSIWSRVNIGKARALIAAGRMTRPGLAAFEGREADRTGVYSFERSPARLPPAFARRLRGHAVAWRYFRSQPAWYQRTSIFWVMSAKKEETRLRRLGTLISCSARGEPIGPLARPERAGSSRKPRGPARRERNP